MALSVCSSLKPPPPGSAKAPCPSSPNCVSSLAERDDQRVAALAFAGDPAAQIPRLRALIEGLPRTRVVDSDTVSLHAEFTSLLLRFVDDVDFQLDAAAHVIDVRSASRTGYSDLGVNRRRIEEIRQHWTALSAR